MGFNLDAFNFSSHKTKEVLSRTIKSLLILIFIVFSINGLSVAQEKLKNQPAQFRLWSGYSFSSVYLLGKTRNATSSIVGIGFRKAIRAYPDNALLYYTADIIPIIHFDYPKRDQNNEFVKGTGFGFSPVGFLFQKKISSLFSYQIGISGSFILMDATFPTDKGRKLNYTFDPSFTIQTHFSKSISLATGYKFHHISNAQTGSENPGVDSNFLFLSLIIK